MRKSILLAPLALILVAAAPAPIPALGRVATPDEVARADISVDPTGSTLPKGSGSVAQGAAVYAAKCQVCHGAGGVGGPADRLTGGIGSLATKTPVKTVNSYWPYATTLFDYTRRAMPLTEPQSLTADEAYALSAYILSIDGVVAKDAVLDQDSLPKVRMPNRDGFVSFAPKPR